MKNYYYHGLDYKFLSKETEQPIESYLLELKRKRNLDFKLKPNITDLPSPFLLPDIQNTIQKISYHMEKKNKIFMSGDKDSDGVCATVLLGNFLKKMYANVEFDFTTNQDYGFSEPLINHILEKKPDLLIALDFGTVHKKEIEILQKHNIEVIVIDHHEPNEQLPNCTILNPKKKDSLYPEKNICTAHIVFLLIAAYLEKNTTNHDNSEIFWKNLEKKEVFKNEILASLDLVSIATITDMMPLINSNRILVKMGCEILTKILEDTFPFSRCSTKVLLNHFKEDLLEINSQILGWKIGPLINAAGRMKKTEVILKFFLSNNESEAKTYLEEILELNKQRKMITVENTKISEMQVLNNTNIPILFLYSNKMKSGVSGIVANEFVRKYKKPTIFIAPEKEFARGSIRTTGSENVLNLLKKSEHLLIQYGGHKQAGGFSLEFENIEEFRKNILQNSYKWWETENKKVDNMTNGSVISFEGKNFTKEILEEINSFEPFGISNLNPLFSIKNASIYNYTKMKEIHAKFKILSSDNTIECIIWNEAKNFDEKIRSFENFDFWGIFEKNYYKKRCKVQFIISHFIGNKPLDEI